MVKIASALCLSVLLLGACLSAQEISGKKNPQLIMDEEAFDSLFKTMSDGPKALSLDARVSFLAPSGLDSKDAGLIIESANRYRSALKSVRDKIDSVKAKAKTEDKSVDPQVLAELAKEQFDSLLQSIATVRQGLGQAKYQKLLEFLNTTVKPTIVIAPPKATS